MNTFLQRTPLLFITLTLALCAALTPAPTKAYAQQGPRIHFADSIHDFGTRRENDGLLQHAFTFVNTGDQPLLLQSVSTSCGCTASDWSSAPILPGQTGTVTATFNPKGRPYTLSKTLTVRSNDPNGSVTLRIAGYIIPHRASSPEKRFQHQAGELAAEAKTIHIGTTINKEPLSFALPLYNASDKTISVRAKTSHKGLKIDNPTLTIPPHDTARLTASLKPNRSSTWGNQTASISLSSYSTPEPLEVLLTYNRIPAPIQNDKKGSIALISTPLHDAGSISAGQTIQHEFTLTNPTNQRINILDALPINQDEVTLKTSPSRINPDGSSTLKVTWETTNLKPGRHLLQITLFTDSPSIPKQDIFILCRIQ